MKSSARREDFNVLLYAIPSYTEVIFYYTEVMLSYTGIILRYL